jgi:hypothetical protein
MGHLRDRNIGTKGDVFSNKLSPVLTWFDLAVYIVLILPNQFQWAWNNLYKMTIFRSISFVTQAQWRVAAIVYAVPTF